MALLATLPGMPVVAAYERGDYATAIRGFRKAAEQGNAASREVDRLVREIAGVERRLKEIYDRVRTAIDERIKQAGRAIRAGSEAVGRQAEQKRKQGHRWDRVEGRIESLIQGRVRSRDRGDRIGNQDRVKWRSREEKRDGMVPIVEERDGD